MQLILRYSYWKKVVSVLAVNSKVLLATKIEEAVFFEEYPAIIFNFG